MVKVNNYAIYVDVPSAKIAVILLHEAEVRYNYQHAKVLQTDEHKRKPKKTLLIELTGLQQNRVRDRRGGAY